MDIVTCATDLTKKLFEGKKRRSGASVFEAHLAPVASLVAENGGNAAAIAAGLLHDAPEDIGPHTYKDIEAISPEVAEIVRMVTEVGEKADWQGRKDYYLNVLVPAMSWWAMLVSVCDKVTQTDKEFVPEWKNGIFGKRPQMVLLFLKSLLVGYTNSLHALENEGNEPSIDHGESLFKNIQGLLHDLSINIDTMEHFFHQAFNTADLNIRFGLKKAEELDVSVTKQLVSDLIAAEFASIRIRRNADNTLTLTDNEEFCVPARDFPDVLHAHLKQ